MQGYTPTAVSQSIPNRRTPSTAFSSSCRYVCATNKIIFCLLCPWLALEILICTTSSSSEWCSSDSTLRPANGRLFQCSCECFIAQLLSNECRVNAKSATKQSVKCENRPGSSARTTMVMMLTTTTEGTNQVEEAVQ